MRTTFVSLLSFFLCYHWIHLSIHFSVTTGKCLENQQLVLLQLKNNLTLKPEKNSNKLKMWNQRNIDCYNWNGVTCDHEGHVIDLNLKGEFITGGFDDSSAIFSLQHLQTLRASNTSFSGPFPHSIGNMRYSSKLDSFCCQFNGTLSNSLSNPSELSYLDLSYNNFTGQMVQFPLTSLSDSGQLIHLDRSHNDLNGAIPSSLFALPLLQSGNVHEYEYGRLAGRTDWNFISVELGFIFGLGLVYFPLLLWERWRIWYWQLTHKILCSIFPQIYLEYVTRRGKTYIILRWQH